MHINIKEAGGDNMGLRIPRGSEYGQHACFRRQWAGHCVGRRSAAVLALHDCARLVVHAVGSVQTGRERYLGFELWKILDAG